MGKKKPMKDAIANVMAGTATNMGNPDGTGPKPMPHTLTRGQQRSFELREAHEDPGIEDKYTLDMPIVDRERQTTDEEDYDRGDYENSYGPGRKYGHAHKPSAANKRMSDMVSAAQQAYSDKHASTPPSNPVKAEKKKSNLIFVKSDHTIDPRTREKVFSEQMKTGDDHKTSVNVSRSPENFGLFTVKKEDGSEVPVNPSHDSVVPRSVVKDVPIGSEHQKAVGKYNESRQNPISPAENGDDPNPIKSGIKNIFNKAVNTAAGGSLVEALNNPVVKPNVEAFRNWGREKLGLEKTKPTAASEIFNSPSKLRGGPSKAKAIAEQKKKEAAARAARGKKPKK